MERAGVAGRSEVIVVSLISEVFYPVLPGGLAQFFRYAPGLREREVQIRVHTALKEEHEGERELEVNGAIIHRHELPDGLGHQAERVELMKRALSGIQSDQSGAAHCLQPNGDTWTSCRLLWRARRLGVPSAYYYTMFPDAAPGRFDKRLRYSLRIRALQSPYAKLIVCSHRMKVAFEQVTGRRSDKMVVLPNGVDLERFAPTGQKTELRRSLGLPEEGEIVLYCGSVTPRKGIDILLEAWGRVGAFRPGAHLVILGSVGMRPSFRDPGMRRELVAFTETIQARLKELQEEFSIILPGEVECVEDYYRVSDLFAFPSRREGLPNAVLEAMSSGLASVVAPFAGIPADGEEFGHHGRHFYRSSHDPKRLAADVLTLLDDPDRRLAMGQAARQWMERTQRPERTLDLLAGYYRAAVGRE